MGGEVKGTTAENYCYCCSIDWLWGRAAAAAAAVVGTHDVELFLPFFWYVIMVCRQRSFAQDTRNDTQECVVLLQDREKQTITASGTTY